MIVETFRPPDLETALRLLGRHDPPTIAAGGGFLLPQAGDIPLAVVDLAGLGLSAVERRGRFLEIGAGIRIAALGEHPEVPAALRQAARLEASFSGQPQATVAGALVGSDGRSVCAAALLALDAQVQLAGGQQDFELGNLLHSRMYFGNLPALPGRLVSGLRINREADLFVDAEHTPGQSGPLVILAAARWASGWTRLVAGGWGRSVRLVLDAPEGGGLAPALASALAEAGDEIASPAQRQAAAARLAGRAAAALGIGP